MGPHPLHITLEYTQTLQPKVLHTYLIKSSDEVVKVGRDLAKLVSTKDLVNELHLLDVGEQVPVVNGEMSSNLTRTVSLREEGDWFLVLVRKWWLCVYVCGGRGWRVTICLGDCSGRFLLTPIPWFCPICTHIYKHLPSFQS